MGLPAQTAKSLANTIIEECGEEKSIKMLERWIDTRGINGNFRIALSDVLVFIKKISKNNTVNKAQE